MPPKPKSMPKKKRASKKKSSTHQLKKEVIESKPIGQTDSYPDKEEKTQEENPNAFRLNEGPQEDFINAPEREV
jgi:hypothetical protein